MYYWYLEKIYKVIDSKAYKNDFKEIELLIEKMNNYSFPNEKNLSAIKDATMMSERLEELANFLAGYLSLRLSVNTEDLEALKQMAKIEKLFSSCVKFEVNLSKYIKDYDNLLEEIKNDNYLKQFSYYLYKEKEDAKRKLSDEEEILLSKLSRSSTDAWEMLFDSLTSTLEVEYDGKIISLPEVRNLAYSSDEDTRKKAYEAELKSYKKIDKSIAASLSSIKQHVTTMAKERGYEDPLDKTLKQTGMTRKTLDALIGAIEEYYPSFRAYLKRKGEILGHKNGLPFYDLFAPLGKSDTTYTIEEANKYLIDRFTSFNEEIGNFMKKSIANNCIDYLPKKGKVGGAFCAESFKIKEPRILTNFDGTFNSVCTLAHELGHGYHAEVMWDYPALNADYPMQLAETASTFNEAFIKDDAIRNSKDKEEKLNILEAMISDDNQVIVDIMSRFYFEKEVFIQSDEAQLTPEELCNIMRDAQLKSYGDGLDPDYLHPYMWCPKGHYYSSGLSFYNFPYAFGQLFAYGLYSIYKEKGGKEFFPLYKKILTSSGSMPIRECVLQAGIDTEDINFWRKSLDIVKERIDEFLEMTK